MFTRVDRGRVPPEKLDAFAAFIAAEILPNVRMLPGYHRAWTGIDRVSGKVTVMTSWRSREERDASAPAFMPVLAHAGRFGLIPVEIELYDDVDMTQRPENETSS